MNDKNVKKQSSACVLDDNSLENVAGGYSIDTIFLSKDLVLSDAEKECLSKDRSWMKNLLDASDLETYKKVKMKTQIACLERHGFTAN